MTTRLALSMAACLSLLGAGCGNHDHSSTDGGAATCLGDPRAMAYAGGMSLTGKQGQFKVELTSSAPAPPYKGDNTWMIKVTDAASGSGIDGLQVSALPFMPDHNHPTPIKVVVTPMPQTAPGVYQLKPVNLFMAGVWETTITMTRSDDTDMGGGDMAGATKVDQVVFSFCIEG